MLRARFRVKAAAALASVAALSITSLALADSLGPVTPTSDGFYLQWSPSGGSTHYTLVDESSCNGTTDYVSETSIGQRDSFGINLSSIPDGATITQIDITPCASKHQNGGSNSTMNVFYRYNGVNSADAGSYSLTGTTPVALATTSFSGLSHVKSSSSTLQIGAVLSAGNKGARLSRMATQVTYTLLNAPSNLSATPSGSQVGLSWTDNATNEDGFKIERSTDGGAFLQITTVNVNVTAYTDTGSTANHSYAYRVRAYNTAGNSAYSNTASAHTYTTPAAPTDLTATNPSGNNIDLQWVDNATDETAYHVERKIGTGSFLLLTILGANSTTHPHTGTGGFTYTYRVRARNGVVYSEYSNEASVTLP